VTGRIYPYKNWAIRANGHTWLTKLLGNERTNRGVSIMLGQVWVKATKGFVFVFGLIRPVDPLLLKLRFELTVHFTVFMVRVIGA
jgi:hypothetical protein